MTAKYAMKLIASLTDRQLEIAEEDVANCLLRAFEAPGNAADSEYYVQYFNSLSGQANAIQAEKERRANDQ